MKARHMRYVTRRRKADGAERHYWQRPGFALRRLPDDPAEQAAEAQRLNEWADQQRDEPAPTPAKGLWPGLIADYRASERFRKLSKSTQEAYLAWFNRMTTWNEYPVPIVGRAAAMTWLDGIPGLSSRRVARAALMSLYILAVDQELIPVNPILGLRLPKPKARWRYVLWTEFDRLRAAARGLNMPDWFDVGLHLYLYTAQRRGDGVTLPWPKQGMIQLRQEKTRQLVAVPVHRHLGAVLDQLPRRGVTIMIDEHGKPVTGRAMYRLFTKVREKAGLEDLQIRDFRRTAVVRMAEAGCTVPQIASITGHSITATQEIIDTYFVATEETAKAAMQRWEEYQPGTESNAQISNRPQKV